MTAGGAIDATGTAACPSSFAGGVPRIVFDTNVLVSLYVFDDSRYAALRQALEQGRLRAVTNEACLAEFARVLAYAQFGVAPDLQARALEDYARHALLSAAPVGDAVLPRCKDPDDQKFLELARDAGAAWLVTSDKALLALARRRRLAHLFRVVTPDAALALLQDAASPAAGARAARSVASASA